MKIEWSASAENDTDNIIDYIDPHNSAAAHRMIDLIQRAVEKLDPYPFVGRQGKVTGTRELVVLKTPYVVVYSVEADHVLIEGVLHTSQLWPPEE